MAFLDWMKRGKQPENGRTAERAIAAIWRPAPYLERSSGDMVQPCIGWSEKGYHAGLVVKPKDGESVTQWGAPLADRQQAMAEAHSVFSGWVESREAQMDAKSQPKDDVKKARRPSPSWER